MKKCISYVLFGNSKLYNQGLIENLKIIPKIYPSWIPRVYVAKDSPILKELKKYNCEIVDISPSQSANRENKDDILYAKTCLRFAPAFEKGVDYVIFRDTDSLVNEKEADAVNEWIESGKFVHRMLDCQAHYGCGIMAGMCGVKGGILEDNFLKCYINFVKTYKGKYGEPWVFSDIYFLKEYIFQPLAFSILTHGINDRAFPGLHSNLEIGRIMNEEWRNEIYV